MGKSGFGKIFAGISNPPNVKFPNIFMVSGDSFIYLFYLKPFIFLFCMKFQF